MLALLPAIVAQPLCDGLPKVSLGRNCALWLEPLVHGLAAVSVRVAELTAPGFTVKVVATVFPRSFRVILGVVSTFVSEMFGTVPVHTPVSAAELHV